MHPGRKDFVRKPATDVRARAALAIACVALACGRSAQRSLDAGSDVVPVDVAPPSEVGGMPLALDFSATGCSEFDSALVQCRAPAPVTLNFAPIATTGLTRFQWTFGDGSPMSTETAPAHIFTLPGRYTVTLTAGGTSGTAMQSHVDYVVVGEVPPGGPCDVDRQCAGAGTCWCGAKTPCDPFLTRGFCARACVDDAATPCDSGTMCVDLSKGVSTSTDAGAPPPWRRNLCLPACDDTTTCSRGTSCRWFSKAPATDTGAWTRACFAPYPFAIGQRCDDANGQPSNADCASGTCTQLGRFGRCSLDCRNTVCPTGAACARWADGRALCVAACSAGVTCDDDPVLACELPGTAPGEFTVTGDSATTVPNATYCAPKRCAASSECGLGATCPAGGGTCQLTSGAL